MLKTEDLGVCSYPNCETCIHKRKNCATFKKIMQNTENLKDYVYKRRRRAKLCFEKLKQIMGEKSPNIFSLGCGLGMDYLGAKGAFRHDMNYFGIENSPPELKGSKACATLKPYLPNTVDMNAGTLLLEVIKENCVVCFFNSLPKIAQLQEIEKILAVLEGKNEFYMLVDGLQGSRALITDKVVLELKLIFQMLDFNVTTWSILSGEVEIIKFQKIHTEV